MLDCEAGNLIGLEVGNVSKKPGLPEFATSQFFVPFNLITMKHILITGVSTGIGYATAQAFVAMGYHVFGSVRRQADADRLQQQLGPHFSPLFFDVTDHPSIAEAAKKLEAEIGSVGLACLINNAGISTSGPLMLQPLDDIRHQFEVNVIGLFAVTQAFLPLLGAKRNPGHPPGRIINISSVGGKIAAPFIGAYVGSKHAVEGMSHSLRRELQLYGIDVIVVGPGAIKTAIWAKQSATELGIFEGSDYAPMMTKFRELFVKRAEAKGLPAEVLGQRLVQIFESRKPKTRYAVVPSWFSDWVVPTILPDRVADRLIGKATGLLRE
jgi:NAD(P)-dependent dehydrogenase (short-subunit alcohol dehydrogenase family)